MLPKKKGLSRLAIFRKKARQGHFYNKFYSKAFCYMANFSNMTFNHVNFKGATLTHCSFKKSSLIDVEFLGTNLKKSNFANASFKYCIFSAALLKGTKFKGAHFENCTFISSNLKVSKDLVFDNSNKILSVHTMPELDSELIHLLNNYRFHPKLQNTRVLFLKSGKLNSLTINLLLSYLSINQCKKGLKNLERYLSSRVVTAYQLVTLIDKASHN